MTCFSSFWIIKLYFRLMNFVTFSEHYSMAIYELELQKDFLGHNFLVITMGCFKLLFSFIFCKDQFFRLILRLVNLYKSVIKHKPKNWWADKAKNKLKQTLFICLAEKTRNFTFQILMINCMNSITCFKHFLSLITNICFIHLVWVVFYCNVSWYAIWIILYVYSQVRHAEIVEQKMLGNSTIKNLVLYTLHTQSECSQGSNQLIPD